MTYEEIIYTAADLASGVAKLMCQLDIKDYKETHYLDVAFRNLQSFAVVYRYNKVFKEDYKYDRKQNKQAD